MKFIISNLLIALGLTTNFSAQKTIGKSVSSPIFKDITDESRLVFKHYNGMTGKFFLPEIMGSGSALFDYDNDGDLDVFVVQGNVLEPNLSPDKTLFPWTDAKPPTGRLFRNDLTKDKTGNPIIKFTDVTEKSGIVADGYGFGAATGDINNDGYTDLYICNLESNKLFLNNKDGTFTDITAKSKTDDARWSVGASFFDYDRDGWLDLMVVNYADFNIDNSPKCYASTSALDYCSPSAFKPIGSSLFRNRGDGTFENATISSGISREFGHGLGIVAADFNDDGWMDVYVANDGDPNQLWLNKKNGKFENAGLLSGAAVNRDGKPEASMGVDAGDFNGDGTEDLFMTHLMDETHTLYKNAGEAIFDDVTIESRIALPEKRFTGFGTAFFDYDNDGLLDVFIANGSVKLLTGEKYSTPGEKFPFGQTNQLFRNRGDETFEDVSVEAGDAFGLPEVSRGASFGDIDNDGDTDIFVVNNNGKARLLLNQAGNKNHWLGLKLIAKEGKRDALGAKAEVFINEKTGKRILRRRAKTDGGYSSAHDPRVTVGLGKNEKVEKIRVTWTGGATEEWMNPPVDKYVTLEENSARKTRND